MLDGLNCFYFALLGVGILYALVILITGGLHDFSGALHLPADFGGHHVPVLGAHGDTNVPSLSPITVASFVTAFGAFGIVGTQSFNVGGGASILFAAIGGLIVAAI